MKKLAALFMVGGLALSSATVLGKASAVEMAGELEKNLQKILPKLQLQSVRETPIEGVYEIYTVNSEIFYVTRDAKYILHGQLFRAENGRFVNLTDEVKSVERLTVLNELPAADLVVFPAEGDVKETITVFTDASCGYCQKFHQEVPAYQKMGVTVQYVAWPRAGAASPAGKTLERVWCAEDKLAAMTKAKSRQSLPKVPAGCDAKIAQQVRIGERIGITGTPAIFTSKGVQVGGYLEAKEFAKRVGLK